MARQRSLFSALLTAALFSSGPAVTADWPRGKPWPIHVIDASSRGADGVRLADVNGDDLMDIATGWEEGGITRVYIHPGHDAATKPWPAVTVGRTPNVEDAVLVDLDADGRVDVVSCCEGKTRTIYVHWAPKEAKDCLEATAWQTQALPASEGAMMWMFCAPADIDGRDGIDLVAGAKGDGAEIGWFEAPKDPRDLDRWRWHPISSAGWIMSLHTVDVDRDGDLDVIATDRKGPMRGCRWLEHPGLDRAGEMWKNHYVGGRSHEMMFMAVADLDTDGHDDLLAAVKPRPLLLFQGLDSTPPRWKTSSIDLPSNIGTGKGVAIGDVDGDGSRDVVFSCEGAGSGKSGVLWLSHDGPSSENAWTPHEISGPRGIKFDRLELLDVDGDGDLDLLTCEESEPVNGSRRGLGVFWYENPTK